MTLFVRVDDVLDFIIANPGCKTKDLRNFFVSNPGREENIILSGKVNERIGRLVKQGRVRKVPTERYGISRLYGVE